MRSNRIWFLSFSGSSSFSSYPYGSSLITFFYCFLSSFVLAFSSATLSLNYSLSIIYFFLRTCLYYVNRKSFMVSKLSPCNCTEPWSIAEHETANFLLHFLDSYLQSIPKYWWLYQSYWVRLLWSHSAFFLDSLHQLLHIYPLLTLILTILWLLTLSTHFFWNVLSCQLLMVWMLDGICWLYLVPTCREIWRNQ